MATYRNACRVCGGPLHCSTCDPEQPLADHTVGCPDCDDKGWGHFEGNRGSEVQRCDCGKFPNDDAAKAAHKADCGCGWGEPWHRHLYEVTVRVIVAAAPGQAVEAERNLACHVQGLLPGLASKLHGGGLMNVCRARTAGTEVRDEHPSRERLVELGVLDEEQS